MAMSLERLEALAAAATRRQSAVLLVQAQAFAASMGDAKTWAEIQKQLIAGSKSGLE